MSEIIVKYRKGLPTEKCMWELIYKFWGQKRYPQISQAYKYNGTIVWQQKGINEKVDEFVAFLSENGVTVKDYSLYENYTVGHIWITKKEKDNSSFFKSWDDAIKKM